MPDSILDDLFLWQILKIGTCYTCALNNQCPTPKRRDKDPRIGCVKWKEKSE